MCVYLCMWRCNDASPCRLDRATAQASQSRRQPSRPPYHLFVCCFRQLPQCRALDFLSSSNRSTSVAPSISRGDFSSSSATSTTMDELKMPMRRPRPSAWHCSVLTRPASKVASRSASMSATLSSLATPVTPGAGRIVEVVGHNKTSPVTCS